MSACDWHAGQIQIVALRAGGSKFNIAELQAARFLGFLGAAEAATLEHSETVAQEQALAQPCSLKLHHLLQKGNESGHVAWTLPSALKRPQDRCFLYPICLGKGKKNPFYIHYLLLRSACLLFYKIICF